MAPEFSIALHLLAVQKAKGQAVLRVSAGSTAWILRMSSVEERDAFVDVVMPLKDAVAASAAPAAQPLPSAALQKEVFERNPDVKELHSRLVVSGFISEAEFWQSKQALVQAAESRGKAQRKGLSTALLTLISGGINSATGTIELNITPEVTNQIFAESPAVKIAYQSQVPHVKSRDAFWGEYFRYVQAKLERRRKRASGTSTATDELLSEFEETLRKYERDAEERKLTQRQSLRLADPTVNLAADYDDGFTAGYGTAHQPGREDPNTGKFGSHADDIMHELNQHAAVVLSGNVSSQTQSPAPSTSNGKNSSADAEKPRNAQDARPLDDLRAPEAPAYIELKINDPNKYFRRSAAEVPVAAHADRPAVPQKALDEPSAQHAVDPELAFAALEEMMAGASKDGGIDEEFGLPRNPATGLIPPMLEGVRKQVLATNELLRHFWGIFVSNRAGGSEKLERIIKAMQAMYDQCMAMQTAAKGMDRVHVTQLLRASLRCMDVAFTRIDNENRAKKARVA